MSARRRAGRRRAGSILVAAPFTLLAAAALLAAAGAAPPRARARAGAQGPDPVAAFAARLKHDVEADGVGSIAAGVVVGDSLVWRAGFGWADREAGGRADGTQVYRVGSITKSVTAVLMETLVQQGRIALDESVATVLPEIAMAPGRPAGSGPITFRELASMTSGLIRDPRDPAVMVGPPTEWSRLAVRAIRSTPYRTPPGTEWFYSNAGFGFLGLALERVAGEPYLKLVHERVLDPFGMELSGFVLTPAMRARLAKGYWNRAGQPVDTLEPRRELDNRGYRVPNGGMFSTVADLARFIAGVDGASGAHVLTDRGRADMYHEATPPGTKTPWGLGFGIYTTADGERLLYKAGGMPGYTSFILFDPAAKVGAIVLRNYNNGTTDFRAVTARVVHDLVRAGAARPATPADSDFTMALVGDAIITRPLRTRRDSAFRSVIGLIRGADVGFANLEMLFHDYEFPPATASGGIHFRADPALAGELAWAGFDMVSEANNHGGDYGPGALLLTRQYAERAGLVSAGAGPGLTEAREARFFESPGGRVGLVAAASTFPDQIRAGDGGGGVKSRPGIDPLRHTTTYVLDAAGFAALRTAARELGRPIPEGASARFLGQRFERGDHPGVRTAPDSSDVAGIARSVHASHGLADYTIVSLHAHEGAGRRDAPADFVVAFAHAMIDAGADVFVGHGPHVLRGVEIYHGRPIFYSLGDFIFENETLRRVAPEDYDGVGLPRSSTVADLDDARYDHDRASFPADSMVWRSVVAIPHWRGHRLYLIELHPIELGFGRSRLERGWPRVPPPGVARAILQNLRHLSAPYGTRIEVRPDDVGIIRLP